MRPSKKAFGRRRVLASEDMAHSDRDTKHGLDSAEESEHEQHNSINPTTECTDIENVNGCQEVVEALQVFLEGRTSTCR